MSQSIHEQAYTWCMIPALGCYHISTAQVTRLIKSWSPAIQIELLLPCDSSDRTICFVEGIVIIIIWISI